MGLHGGASLVRYRPDFSNDGKRLLVCTASSVTVLSVATALPVLQLVGHDDTVTSVTVVPTAGGGKATVNHVWTSSLDGSIRLWDYEAGTLIRTVTVGKPIESMVIPTLLKPTGKAGNTVHHNVAFISVRWDRKVQKSEECSWTGRILLLNLSTGKPLPGFLAKTLIPHPLVVSPHGSLVGMTEKRKLWVWSVPAGIIEHVNLVRSRILHHTKICKVMAFDPTETVVAGGDETGRILCWHNVGERREEDAKGGVRGEDDAQACTTYHWHANEVQSLLFSDDGTYLFSGGTEETLVIWQSETGKQQFFPRLGGQLSFIVSSPDPSVLAISCLDNAIRFVNIGSMTVEKTCQGIKPVVQLPKVLKSKFHLRGAFDPHAGRLILPTDNISLQFYDAVHDHDLFQVQVTPGFNIGAVNNKSKVQSGPTTFVTQVTFSTDRSVMATVDIRLPEEKVGGVSCLKFWDLDARKLGYHLNTLVDEPHAGEIAALVCHPTEKMVVSCSVDGTFKVWVPQVRVGVQDNAEKESGWRCRSVGSYRHKKMLAAAFSPDGSLLAVSAEDLVTLWNPYTNGYIRSLACIPSLQSVTLLAFIHNSKCLVAVSTGGKPRLVVWHLPTLSVQWSCNVHIEALSVDPTSSNFGVIAVASSPETGKVEKGGNVLRKAMVAIFKPDSPTPTALWSIQEGVGGSLFFGSPSLLTSPRTGGEGPNLVEDKPQSCMVVLTGSREYVLLNPEKQDSDPERVLPKAVSLDDKEASSAYTAMYGKLVSKEKNKVEVGMLAPKPWGDLFNAPSHVLPSLTRVSVAFMESLLQKNCV